MADNSQTLEELEAEAKITRVTSGGETVVTDNSYAKAKARYARNNDPTAQANGRVRPPLGRIVFRGVQRG